MPSITVSSPNAYSDRMAYGFVLIPPHSLGGAKTTSAPKMLKRNPLTNGLVPVD